MGGAVRTEHAHSKHEGVHGVGEAPASRPRPRRKHHLLGLSLLAFYLRRGCGNAESGTKQAKVHPEVSTMETAPPNGDL